MQIFPLIDPYAVHTDGSRPLTADWDAGAFKITAGDLVASGIDTEAFSLYDDEDNVTLEWNEYQLYDESINVVLNWGTGEIYEGVSTSINWKDRTLSDEGSNEMLKWYGGLGFFGATPVAQPTGVAVSAAGIHAALVSLGLITA